MRTTSQRLKLPLQILALLIGSLSAITAHAGPYDAVLQKYGIEPDTAGLHDYFAALLEPLEKQRLRIAPWMKQLESDEFAAREEAMHWLLRQRMIPSRAIREAAADAGPEIKWRAEVLLKKADRDNPLVLHAALKTVGTAKISGLTPQLMQVVTYCSSEHADQRYLQVAVRQALAATVSVDDLDVLRKAIAGKDAALRAASTTALTKILKADSAATLHPLLDDKDDRVAMAAARGIANLGDRRCLAPLVRLLSSKQLLVRVDASSTLRRLTKKQFSYAAYQKNIEKRTAAIKKWQDWLAADGKTAALTFPLKSHGEDSHLHGNMLVACGSKNRVVEFNAAGEEVWTYPVNNVWSAEKLANGNVLMAVYGQSKVIEVSPAKEIVWEHTARCLNAKPLANGNVLLACYSTRKVQEVDRDKNVVWTYQAPSNCADAQRLENGNTLIAAQKQVIEVNPEGDVVWKWEGGRNVYGVRRLRNGNTLISDISLSKVIEINPAKEVVWEFAERYAADAFRLPNGNTLITSNQRVVEVSADKEVIWEKPGLTSYGTARK